MLWFERCFKWLIETLNFVIQNQSEQEQQNEGKTATCNWNVSLSFVVETLCLIYLTNRPVSNVILQYPKVYIFVLPLLLSYNSNTTEILYSQTLEAVVILAVKFPFKSVFHCCYLILNYLSTTLGTQLIMSTVWTYEKTTVYLICWGEITCGYDIESARSEMSWNYIVVHTYSTLNCITTLGIDSYQGFCIQLVFLPLPRWSYLL